MAGRTGCPMVSSHLSIHRYCRSLVKINFVTVVYDQFVFVHTPERGTSHRGRYLSERNQPLTQRSELFTLCYLRTDDLARNEMRPDCLTNGHHQSILALCDRDQTPMLHATRGECCKWQTSSRSCKTAEMPRFSTAQQRPARTNSILMFLPSASLRPM